jgi:hypothetical protein
VYGGRPETTGKNRFVSFYLPPGGFTIPVASRRSNFSPAQAEGEAEFTAMKRRIDASQFLRGQSENYLTARRFMFEANITKCYTHQRTTVYFKILI